MGNSCEVQEKNCWFDGGLLILTIYLEYKTDFSVVGVGTLHSVNQHLKPD